jgi:hypothetical protein
MARIFTTPTSEIAAKAWMHDIMVIAGVRTNNQRKAGANSFSRYQKPPVVEAQQICDELINRNFANIDSSINRLSQYRFSPSLVADVPFKSYKPEAVAKAIVYTAELLNLYWDDTIRTPYEIDEFKKTILGDAVYKYGRYISAIQDKTTKSRASAGSANSTGGSLSKAPGQPPQNGYKSSGPQSGNVRDLRDVSGGTGTPGQKVTAGGQFIYKIIADKVGKNTPNVFIKPLSASGEINGTNKIFISSGNGYTDCTCYFDDPNDAQDFLDKIVQNNRVPSNIVNLRVVKMSADSNGYFLVGTEFGVVAVSAKTLNEALTEAASEINEEVSGWEKATEGYDKEKLAELHDWMRRD